MMFDPTPCELGEGALWHDGRQSLFWFDIMNRKLFERTLDGHVSVFEFDYLTSAAAIVDDNSLLVASEVALSTLDLETGHLSFVANLEADDDVTRSNDGRADPFGGFWIGTMGKNAEKGAGSIWRFFRGELKRLYTDLTITNSICFCPKGKTAYFADTISGQIMSVSLDTEGWPVGTPDVFVDLREHGLNPDGAITDRDGNLWSAQWGASRVACYNPKGMFLRSISFPASQTSCPAFGGVEFDTLFVTTAREGLAEPDDVDGAVYAAPLTAVGLPSARVIL